MVLDDATEIERTEDGTKEVSMSRTEVTEMVMFAFAFFVLL